MAALEIAGWEENDELWIQAYEYGIVSTEIAVAYCKVKDRRQRN